MVSISDINALLNKSGVDLLDSAASLVKVPYRPSEKTKPVMTAAPADLDGLISGWTQMTRDIGDDRTQLDNTWKLATDTWHGPAARNFSEYMPKLVELVRTEEQVMGKFPDHLGAMKQAIEDAKREQEHQNDQTWSQIKWAVIGAVAGAAIGAFTGGTLSVAVAAGLIGALIGFFAAWESHSNGIEHNRDTKLLDLQREIDKLKEEVKSVNVTEVGLPAIVTPDFSFSQFWNEHQPPKIPRVGD